MFFSNVSVKHPVSFLRFLVRYAKHMDRIWSDPFTDNPIADFEADVKHLKKDEAKQLN